MRKGEKGVALVEATIVLSLLITLLLVLFDLYFMNATYVNISQFAREGVMTGSGMSYFSPDAPLTVACPTTGMTHDNLHEGEDLPNDGYYRDCRGFDATTCGHYLIQWRVEMLLNTLNMLYIDKANRRITTTCTAASGGVPGTLKVEVAMPFKGFTPFFRNTILRVSQFGVVR